ncbi:MAG: glycosyltransferase family 4 protein [Anaerolineae bacterium]|nr:glycosyltransferase family 4 protein [Anaerolineae bacterium]
MTVTSEVTVPCGEGRWMRIGIDARITYYARGGIRNYTLQLLEALARLDGETEYWVLHSRKARTSFLPGPNFRRVSCWTPSHHRLERWALGAEIARLRLDLLHTTDFIPPAFGYRRSVITVHDLTFLHYPQFITAQSYAYYNRQIAWAVRRADHILADSFATREDLVTLLGVAPEKITVVPLAADRAFRPLPEEEVAPVVARYRLQPGYLLTVGTLEPRKNLPGLLRAYRLLLDEEVTDAPLVVIGGRGWLYQDIFACVQELRLTGQVHFLHAVPDTDLPALYNAAMLLTTPSFYEGFGLPALEAMACGTPVVVSDRSSLPEVVGEAGLLVNPEDVEGIAGALARVLTDEMLRRRMRELGLAQAARFSWESTARLTLGVYRTVLAVA